ncbi:energy-coupling factor transporter transmembrane component T family protein [Lentibacillus cibarius]|uniref:Energy-coupling factor transporter transmembrane protein EcfT n=1 Tax=Lentibacillus cibarius TaxID=2583219 RepID=A0A5S3QG38_9BACI|nr:energy-coupling factor transporter transmembrane component T [Lentibacillus cibarius]TMN20894.1 energy-coupling factor transporter transmembrane protein EcfT [Lentibacillus cibarius]
MSEAIILGQYIEKESILHRLDPRTKLVSMVSIMVWFVVIQSVMEYMLATVFTFFLLFISNVSIRYYWKSLRPILFILLFTAMYNAFLTKGEVVLWEWSVFHLTQEGIYQGIRFAWRIVLLILMASILTFTTKPLSLTAGLERLLKPLSRLGIPVEQFSLMVTIAIRFIPTIVSEFDRIVLAQKARGIDVKERSLIQRLFLYLPMLIPLLFSLIQRAETLAEAIDSRVYGKGKNRTSYRSLQLSAADYRGLTIVHLFVVSGVFWSIYFV